MNDNIDGLTNEEVIKLRKIHGNNKLTSKKKVTVLNLIIESLNDPIVKILLIALGIKILLIRGLQILCSICQLSSYCLSAPSVYIAQ